MRWMWIDRIVELVPRERMVAIKNISLAEEHLHDHFAADDSRGLSALPVMPFSLIIEGMAQTAGVLVGHANSFREKVILAKVSKAEIDFDPVPGQTLRYTATIDRLDETGAATLGIIEVIDHQTHTTQRIGAIDLMFSHIDKNMGGLPFPKHNFVFGEAFKTLIRTSGYEIPGE
ncbi:MAG: beta-hydroxyacyl-ACP dehydratase [Phycisphaerales bacterium]